MTSSGKLIPENVFRAHTNAGVQQRTLLRRVLRRVLETAFEKVLRRVLRRDSKKGLSRRHLEGRSTEYDPLGVCPSFS